ncbi:MULTISPECIES: hypothetical protein [Pseudomonas]|uniref:Uncharacterized protein n=1 Tax=Pseudomonas fluorescens (strain Q2-87) TaxID=1038922 RepID=J2MQ71_PSEFQ|nr:MULTISPECIES: hypothetical protein [Pseudomonas]EJL03107.1 Hypothetical protein PflQ2_2736 [Pseudomonas fluorescens Q2-87]
MTLIITVASPLFVIQAGDRLLTTQADDKTQQFDDKSNKNLIYEASDGILTISYCGAAFMRGKPTDEWIAEQLDTRIRIPTDGSDPWAMQLGGLGEQKQLHFDGVIKQIKEKLTRISQGELLSSGLTIVIAGWKRKRDKWKRVLIEVSRSRSSLKLSNPVGFKERPGIKGNCGIDMVGSGCRPETEAYFDVEWKAVHERQGLPDFSAYEQYVSDVRDAMVATIKFASTIEKTVGANVHTATIYGPEYQSHICCETHFFSDMLHPAVIETPTKIVSVADAGVTGWVLFPDIVKAPAYLVGTELTQGRFTILRSNGSPSQAGVHHFQQTVPRRRA